MTSFEIASDRQELEVTSLKKRRDFLHLRKAKAYRCKYFVVAGNEHKRPHDQVRVGFTVTTKLGNAVVRNRIKRRLRAVAAAILPEKGLRGFDYVVIARRATVRAEYADLIREFSIALDHLRKNGSKG